MVHVPAPTKWICPETILATAVLELEYVIAFVPEVTEVAPGAKSASPTFFPVGKAPKVIVWEAAATFTVYVAVVEV